MRFAANAQVDGQKLFKALTGFDKRLTLNAAPPVTLTLKDTTLNREDLLMLCVKVMERLLARMDLEAAITPFPSASLTPLSEREVRFSQDLNLYSTAPSLRKPARAVCRKPRRRRGRMAFAL